MPVPGTKNENRPRGLQASHDQYYKPVLDDSFTAPVSESRPDPNAPKPEVGKTYQGKVDNAKDYGVFVEFLPGVKGLLHISNLPKDYLETAKKGDPIEVTLKKIDDQGRFDLSVASNKAVKSSP